MGPTLALSELAELEAVHLEGFHWALLLHGVAVRVKLSSVEIPSPTLVTCRYCAHLRALLLPRAKQGENVSERECPTCGKGVTDIERVARPCGPDPMAHRRDEPDGPLLMERVDILRPCGHEVSPA